MARGTSGPAHPVWGGIAAGKERRETQLALMGHIPYADRYADMLCADEIRLLFTTHSSTQHVGPTVLRECNCQCVILYRTSADVSTLVSYKPTVDLALHKPHIESESCCRPHCSSLHPHNVHGQCTVTDDRLLVGAWYITYSNCMWPC